MFVKYILVTVEGGLVTGVSVYGVARSAVKQAEAFCEDHDPDDCDVKVYAAEVEHARDLEVVWTPKGKTYNDRAW